MNTSSSSASSSSTSLSGGPLASLHKACRTGDVAAVKKILAANGADKLDVNGRDSDGYTPLCVASRFGYVEVVKALLNAPPHVPDINAQTTRGWTSLSLAICSHQDHVAELLLKTAGVDVNASKPLWCACMEGRTHVVKILLACPAIDVNQASTGDEETPLTVACEWGHKEIVRLLLEAPSIDTNKARKRDGATPLVAAILKDHLDIAKLVSDHGSTVPPEWEQRVEYKLGKEKYAKLCKTHAKASKSGSASTTTSTTTSSTTTTTSTTSTTVTEPEPEKKPSKEEAPHSTGKAEPESDPKAEKAEHKHHKEHSTEPHHSGTQESSTGDESPAPVAATMTATTTTTTTEGDHGDASKGTPPSTTTSSNTSVKAGVSPFLSNCLPICHCDICPFKF
ncbi:NB-ARC and ankyrin domain protein [Pelomyxa schiedti]|nr:NB-ARC and ankyrin domain protein [Pelomyxa schiedti]KAH3732612.1 NB-ARC and ankyrin domain protein [Pelomyxa schiedti]